MTVAAGREAAAERPTLRHMPGLDGLRGLAVAGVLLFHAGHLVGGYLGVDLFFVLSGFLITSLLLREAGTRGGVDLPAFWARRARRLLPALGGVLLGVAAYARFVADAAELARIRADGIAAFLYVANWRNIVADTDYWDLFTAPSPLQHLWSIAIEEQFYLVWPLAVLALVRWRGVERLASSVLVAAGASAGLSVVLMAALHDPADRSRAYFGTDTRAASILVGVALAALLARRGTPATPAGRRVLEGTGLVAAGIVGVAWCTVDGRSEWLYRGGMFLLAVCCAVVIAAASVPVAGPLARALSVRPLRALGRISYGVYLWHWPVYLTLDHARTGLDGWALIAVRVGATLAVAVVSYTLLEQPIRRGWSPERRSVRRLALPVGAGTVVTCLVMATAGAVDVRADEVVPDALPAALAEVRAAPDVERLMVVGNSVGLYLGEGLDRVARDLDIVPVNRALLGCTFPTPEAVRLRDGTPFPQGVVDCTTSWADDVEALRPDLVVFPMVDPSDAEYQLGGEWVHPCMPSYDARLRAELERSVQALTAHGGRVALVTAPYSAYAAVYPVQYERTDCVNGVVAEVAALHDDVLLVDLARRLCDRGRPCREQLGGVTLRTDGLHFKGEAAALVARIVVADVRAQPG